VFHLTNARRRRSTYCFLYEGTPGGRLGLDNDVQVTSTGVRSSVAEAWSGGLLRTGMDLLWHAGSRQVLFPAMQEDHGKPGQCWPMESNMAVFGFGRQYCCSGRYLDKSPARFTIGLAPAGPEQMRLR